MQNILDQAKEIKLADIRVLGFNLTSYHLILVCDNKNHAEVLYYLIQKYPYVLNVRFNNVTNYFSATLNFSEIDLFYNLNTTVTEVDYPNYTNLKNGQVHFITTGSIQFDREISAYPVIPFLRSQLRVE